MIGPVEASMSIAVPMLNTGATILRIDKARDTTMRTCNSGSAAAPVEQPALGPARLRAARLRTGCGQGPALTGRTSAIALSARIAVIELARTGRLTGKPEIGVQAQGTCGQVARRREPGISGRALAYDLQAGDERPQFGVVVVSAAAVPAAVVPAVAVPVEAVGVAAVGAGRTSD